MGFYGEFCTKTKYNLNPLQNSSDSQCYDCNEHKVRVFLMKLIWDLGLSCFLPPRQRRNLGEKQNVNREKKSGTNLEHNKAWLLAEAGGCGAELSQLTSSEPQSVHSSFRFSFCSQVELEAMNANSLQSATVLMVNLDNGFSDVRTKEQKWRRMESLERSISPVANSLIRFSYGEILSATRNFSKGNPEHVTLLTEIIESKSKAHSVGTSQGGHQAGLMGDSEASTQWQRNNKKKKKKSKRMRINPPNNQWGLI